MDRTTTIRASVHDIEFTLIISVVLVILVVFVFLRNVRATFIPSIAVPVSLIGTFGVDVPAGLQPRQSFADGARRSRLASWWTTPSSSSKTLRAISKRACRRWQAALRGAREIGFTVLSMSMSLIAVFIPILLMGGIVGRLFREFAVTLSIAIAVSLLVSLTVTPMMCAQVLDVQRQRTARPHLPLQRKHLLTWIAQATTADV